MSQCDRVLAVLEDGREHTIAEIHERAGTMRLNSRVAELRNRLRSSGKTIVCTARAGTYSYTLVPLNDAEGALLLGPAGPSASLSEAGRPDTTGASPASLDPSEGVLADRGSAEPSPENLTGRPSGSAPFDSPEQLTIFGMAA